MCIPDISGLALLPKHSVYPFFFVYLTLLSKAQTISLVIYEVKAMTKCYWTYLGTTPTFARRN
jgi:hypothetical protein